MARVGPQRHRKKKKLKILWDGTDTVYGLDVLAFEPQMGREFPHCPYRSWSPPSLLYNGYRVFLGRKAVGT